MKKQTYFFISVVICLVVFSAGFSTSLFIAIKKESSVEYDLLARRAQISDPNDPIVNFTALRGQVEDYIASLGDEEKDVSVYFEYLPTGVSININEKNESIAASLMKVPVVMTLYKLADEGKIDLDKTVALKSEWLNDEYGSLYKKGAGYTLTIREAAELTLEDSDNTALFLIFDQVGGEINGDMNVLNFLDLEYGVTAEERVQLGARSYGSILKCLYLACYNSKDSSQEILNYLTKSSNLSRLKLELPEELRVAHKIGTFSKEYQSDCGIFYEPYRNYLLCVMVKGEDPEASKIIANISKRVYTYVSEKVPQESSE